MRRRTFIFFAGSLAALLALAVLPGAVAVAAGSSATTATVVSVSCPSSGSCAAGGYSTDASDTVHAFVLSERSGRWGRAARVPGLKALSPHNSEVSSVSCGSAGNCAAGGFYEDASFRSHPFVATERNGRWGQATEVSGAHALKATQLYSVSCPAPGNCVASGGLLGYVVSERNGRWGRAIPIPGLASLNKGGGPTIGLSVSCASAGNCAVAGTYEPKTLSGLSVFVVSERNGRWGHATAVPGLAALDWGQYAGLPSVSCGSAGNCAVGGIYRDASFTEQAFVAAERNGRWGQAIEVPGTAALSRGGSASVLSVSCAPAGNCAAGGQYARGSSQCDQGSSSPQNCEAFVVSEKNGHWAKAIEVPGTAARNVGGIASVFSVSCASAGACAAGGAYAPVVGGAQVAFVVSERGGRWTKAIEVPGLAALDTARESATNSVSCSSAGACAAGGEYSPEPAECPTSPCPAFVASAKHGVWGRAQPVRF
jgi:hypothetical protein